MSVSFSIELVDEVSGPAKAAASSTSALQDEMKKLNEALHNSALKAASEKIGKMAEGEQKQIALMRLRQKEMRPLIAAESKAAKDTATQSKAAAEQSKASAAQQESALLGVKGAALAVGVAIAGMSISLAKAGAVWLADAQKFKEKTLFSWKYMLGSGEQAKKTFADAQRIANTLGSSVSDVASQIQEAMSAGTSADQAERMVQMVSDLRTMGSKDASVGQLVDVIKTMKSGQGLNEQLLAPLTAVNQGAAIEALAKHLPIVAKEGEARKQEVLQKLGQLKGQKGVDAFQDAFRAVVQSDVAGKATQKFHDETVTGSFDKIKHNIEGLFTSLETGDAGTALVAALQKIAAAFDIATPEGKQLKATLTELVSVAGKLLEKVDVNQLVGGFVKLANVTATLMPYFEALGGGLLDGIGDVLSPLFSALGGADGKAKPINALVIAFKWLGRGLVWVSALAALATAAVTAIGISPVLVVVGAIMGIGAAFTWIKSQIPVAWAAIKGAISDAAAWAKGIGTQIVAGIKSGLTSTWDGLVEKLRSLVAMLPESVKSLLGIHSPSRVFAEIGMHTVQGFTEGVEGEAGSAREATLSAVSPKMMGLGASLDAPAQTGAARGSSVTVNVTIEGGSADARRAAEEGVTAGIMRAFEALGIETGAI